MVSWWVPYLAKGPRPDFNNCPWDNLNSSHILASGVYSSLTQIMAPLQVIPISVRGKIHPFRSPTYGLIVGAISGQGPRPDFNNGPGDNPKSGRISAPQRLLESDSNNAPPGHSDLGMLKKITTACTIAVPLNSLFFPTKLL